MENLMTLIKKEMKSFLAQRKELLKQLADVDEGIRIAKLYLEAGEELKKERKALKGSKRGKKSKNGLRALKTTLPKSR